VGVIISPTEPPAIKALGTVSGTPESYGCDILIVTGLARTGIQRKKFPDDLLASLGDGRLYTQLPKMAALDRSVLIFEGLGKWTLDGELITPYARSFTRQGFYSLKSSIMWEFGVHIETTRDLADTVDYLKALELWATKPKHTSLRTRPGAPRNSWGDTGLREQAMHMIQGLPGIGVELAGRIYDHFGRIPLRWDCTKTDLLAVPGVGKIKAQKIWEALPNE